eukprot:TRINITY_DN3085_c0_g2_i1.p1 TRINITY_DN3085_c0_g2~~TRINITY_DN3085_c0_g2_i1.p1  ORF type:complete len:211 (-),score=22.72 TRINITY_DN3085_c0_g2_i1:4-636(-)
MCIRDRCEKCVGEGQEAKKDYFELLNQVNENVVHHYHKCNRCGMEPIWGPRFVCKVCENFDLCESCVDVNIDSEEKFHDVTHDMEVVEVPLVTHGLPAHAVKCIKCYQKPIIGTLFICSVCDNYAFCQNCYFKLPLTSFTNVRGHKAYHRMEILLEPVSNEKKEYKCGICEVTPIKGIRYKCLNCFDFNLCEQCYLNRDNARPLLSLIHI